MPREVDLSRHIEEESSEEGRCPATRKSNVLSKLIPSNRKYPAQQLGKKTPTENSPAPRRTHGASYRNRIIVISDSESDSDLPSPSRLLHDRRTIGPTSNFGNHTTADEIIEISSDSEIEATPTKPRGNKHPSSTHVHPTAPVVSSGSTSVSALTSVFQNSLSLNTTDSTRTSSAVRSQPGKNAPSSRSTEPSSTDSESVDETNIFDQDAYHPGILQFDPGPRKPALITSRSGASISTPGTSDHSQDWCGEGGTQSSIRVGTPSQESSDESSEDVGEIKNPVGPSRPRNATGNAKAGSSGSGYRSRVRADINEGAAPPETPRPRPKPKARSAALTSTPGPTLLSPKPTPRNQAKVLQAAALALFAELNDSVFGGKLPKDCPIEWSKKLNTTAGRAHWKRTRDTNGNVTRHDTRIELSTKVVDCEERVRNTLSHEMCHLGAWIFDSETKPPHGPAFKRWSGRIMQARPDIAISTCHSYEISYKYEWKCSSEPCGRTYGRHSKSIDPEKQVCGVCRSKLVPQFETAPKRTAFQDYLKIHMKDFKTANPGMQHGEAMKRLGEMFRAEKEATVDEELDQVMAGMTRLVINRSPK